MSTEPKITNEEDVHEHVLEGEPITVKDYRLALLLCYGLPILLSIYIGFLCGGFLFTLFAVGLFLPLSKTIYDLVVEG